MSYFFVGGSQRSGTSLMLRILCDDAETNPMFGECAYLRALMQAYEVGLQTFDELMYLFDSREQFRDFHAELVRRFLAHTSARFAPARHLVLKEPHMTLYFPELHELLGDEARFLVLMRDPRDVIASMLDVGRRMAAQGISHLFNQGNLFEMVNQFKFFYVKCFAACNQNPTLRRQLLVVRYENLVSQPEQELEKIRAFTGLALSNAGKQAPGAEKLRAQSSERQQLWRTELSGQAISASKINNYREKLTHLQIQQIEAQCQDIMKIFGYQRSA